MMPFRAAMPRTVTNPTSDPSDSTPPDRNAPATPPTNAKGRLVSTRSVRREDWKSACRHERDAHERRAGPNSEELASARLARCVLAQHLGVVAAVEREARCTRASMSRAHAAEVAALDVAAPRRCRRDAFSRWITFGDGADEDVRHVPEGHLPPPGQSTRS